MFVKVLHPCTEERTSIAGIARGAAHGFSVAYNDELAPSACHADVEAALVTQETNFVVLVAPHKTKHNDILLTPLHTIDSTDLDIGAVRFAQLAA